MIQPATHKTAYIDDMVVRYQDGDDSAIDDLLKAMDDAVYAELGRLKIMNRDVVEDAHQDGRIAVVRAARKWDRHHGRTFAAYASAAIHSTILRGLKIRHPYGLGAAVARFELDKAERHLRNALQREPSDEELSQWMGKTVRRVREIRRVQHVMPTMPVLKMEVTVAFSHVDEETTRPSYPMKVEDAMQCLSILPPAHRDIVEQRILHGMKLREIGEKHRISKERVRQIVDKCLKMMRERIERDQELDHA